MSQARKISRISLSSSTEDPLTLYQSILSMPGKISISAKQVKAMARELENGYNVYLNTDTGEYKALSDMEQLSTEGLFHTDEHRKITDHWDHYIIISILESWELFEVMENFMFEVDSDFHYRLLEALYQTNPFERFQYLVETSRYKEAWISFKRQKFIQYVEDQLKAENIALDSKST